jgi:hypothetical protein
VPDSVPPAPLVVVLAPVVVAELALPPAAELVAAAMLVAAAVLEPPLATVALPSVEVGVAPLFDVVPAAAPPTLLAAAPELAPGSTLPPPEHAQNPPATPSNRVVGSTRMGFDRIASHLRPGTKPLTGWSLAGDQNVPLLVLAAAEGSVTNGAARLSSGRGARSTAGAPQIPPNTRRVAAHDPPRNSHPATARPRSRRAGRDEASVKPLVSGRAIAGAKDDILRGLCSLL